MILGASPTSQACLVEVPWKQLVTEWTSESGAMFSPVAAMSLIPLTGC